MTVKEILSEIDRRISDKMNIVNAMREESDGTQMGIPYFKYPADTLLDLKRWILTRQSYGR